MFSLFNGGRVGFVLVFLMHEVPDECEKDSALYQLKLHVSNRTPVFQKDELNLRLLVLFLASRKSQNTYPCIMRGFFFLLQC